MSQMRGKEERVEARKGGPLGLHMTNLKGNTRNSILVGEGTCSFRVYSCQKQTFRDAAAIHTANKMGNFLALGYHKNLVNESTTTLHESAMRFCD